MLELKDVHTYYGNIHALKGISLTVNNGEIVTLIGSNGAGKSTTLRTIQGLNKPRSGSIVLDGVELHKLPAHEISAMGVAQSPEGRMIFPRMTVMENLEMGAYVRKDLTTFKDDLEHVFSLFATVLPREPIKIAFRALHTDDKALRSLAAEYLDSILPPNIRERLWTMVEPCLVRNKQDRESGKEALDKLLHSHESLMLIIDKDKLK